MQKQILHNQSVLDLAIQSNGTVLSVFELMLKNGLSLTAELVPGQTIEIVESVLKYNQIVDYLSGKQLVVATGFNGSQNQNIIPKLGIGSMVIGTTFIVG